MEALQMFQNKLKPIVLRIRTLIYKKRCLCQTKTPTTVGTASDWVQKLLNFLLFPHNDTYKT